MSRYDYVVPEPVRDLIKWELKNYYTTIRTVGTVSGARPRERMEQVIGAIEETIDESDPIDRKIAELSLIKCYYNAVGAGMCVGCSQSEAYARINSFIARVAIKLGYDIKKKERA